MGSQDMQNTTFLINDTQIGFLAPGGRRNHVLSSHRYIQLLAGLRTTADDPALATAQQRENLRLWQRCSRDVQQRGLNILTQAVAHYGLRPDWLLGIDDHFMHAWLLERYAIYLMRDGELFQVEPVSDNQTKIPGSWRGHLHQSVIEIAEGDYYLFLPPDFFNVVTSEEVQNILSGLQQLSVKINELVEIARLRKYDLADTWMALQIQKIEPDTQQTLSLLEQWKSFRKSRRKPTAEETANHQARNSSLRQTTSIHIPDDKDARHTGFEHHKVKKPESENYSAVDRHSNSNADFEADTEKLYRPEKIAKTQTTGRNINQKDEKSQGLIDRWLSWNREKKLLSVIIALAVIVLLAWGISGLFDKEKSDNKGAAQTSESTVLPTPTPLPPAVTTTAPPVEVRMAVNVRSLNFREAPGTDAALITTLSEGSEVIKIGDSEQEGWIKVLLDDGKEAYAFAEYLTEISQDNTDETQS
jgi:hypothetical protein